LRERTPGRTALDWSIIEACIGRDGKASEVAEATKINGADEGMAAAAEAIREAAREEAPKHRRLLRSQRDGRVLSAMMLPLFWPHAPGGFAVITTVGRKSGKPRRKCVRAIRRGNTAYIVALRPPEVAIERPTFVSGWVWNIRANPIVRLHLGVHTHTGRAHEIDDPVELEHAREAVCETVNASDYGECLLHLRGLPTREKIMALHRYWFDTGIPLAVDLSGSRVSREEL
jgi:deazaflavin-dependent oxidoreductase (nitroreductase family)